MGGPYFYSYNSKYSDNATRILGNSRQSHLDSADVFSKKTYAGGKFAILIDNRNREFFPTRGIQWDTELVGLTGIRKEVMIILNSLLTSLSMQVSVKQQGW